MSVLVGMVISGLMIGFVYSIYTNLNQITYGYQANHTKINEYNIAKADLKRELEQSIKLSPYPNGFSLKQNDNEINYFVKNNQLIKKTNGNELIIFETIKSIKIDLKDNKEIITAITIDFLLGKQEFRFYIYPIKDLQSELNLSLINE